jgi:hypothetical protein
MLTYCRVCCAFESVCALPSGVIQGCETISINKSRFSVKPSSLTGFGEERQVLFRELKFSLMMADTIRDGTGQAHMRVSFHIWGVFLWRVAALERPVMQSAADSGSAGGRPARIV